MLKLIKEWIIGIEIAIAQDNKNNFKKVDDINLNTTYNFGDTNYLVPEFDFINKCAYFDYQRNKIYVKTDKNIKKAIEKKKKRTKFVNKIDKIININHKCPICTSEASEILMKRKRQSFRRFYKKR